MRRLVIALFAVLACSSGSSTAPVPAPPTATTPAPPPSPTPPAQGSDPWAAPETKPGATDDAPSLVANHARAEKVCPAVTAPYFYSIAKNGKTSVILGTRHIGVGLAKMPKVVKDRLMAAKLAVLETPPDDSDSEPDRSGPSLADQVGPALWKHFVDLVGKDAADAIEHQKPSIAVASLAGIYEDMSQTLDMEIEKVAAAHGIPIQGLETSEFQDKLLDKLLDLRMLKAILAGTKTRDELVHDSVDDLAKYCAGADTEPGMDARMKKEMRDGGYSDKEIADLDDVMLYARNRDWIPKLDKILARGDVFIAVGADHLRGPRGVIAALAAKGYTTARIAP